MPEQRTDLTWESLIGDNHNDFSIGLGFLGNKMAYAESLAPVLVIGPPQSRKTSGIITPAIQRWAGPAVIVTRSVESVEQSIETRASAGKVWVLDPHEILPPWSIKAAWSPLDEIKTWTEAQRLATGLMLAKVLGLQDGDFWRTAASQMLAPHLYAAAKNGYTMKNVVRWIRTQEEFEVRSLLQAIGEDDPITAAEAGWQREDRARSSIYTTIEVYLRAWTDESISISSSIDRRFSTENLLDGEPNTLYIVLPALESDSVAAFSSAIISHLLQVITRRNRGFASHLIQRQGILAALEESPKKAIPVLIVIDDAAVVAPMANLSALTFYAAQHAIQLVVSFSDISEIRTVLGDTATNSYLNRNLAIVMTPGTRDVQMLEYAEKLRSGSRATDGQQQRTATQLNDLPRGSALCFYASLPTVTVTFYPVSDS